MAARTCLFILLASVAVVDLKEPCSSKPSCSACIQTNSCIWCSDPAWRNSTFRCSQKQDSCREEFVVNPRSSSTNLVDNPLVSQHENESKVLQLAPQQVQLNARIDSPVNLTLRYKRAQNPVDLYYLMDLSNSMRDDKDTLARLGNSLKDLLSSYTSDLRLGFGSFVDKTIGPYTDTTPAELKSPCKNCTAPYGFRNHMKLTSDLHRFAVEMGNASVSGNIDKLEGGFDALMQAIVCHEEIGWRNNARRVLVFSTDDGFHMAGDGKLGGIVTPNDGECHMKNGLYTHSLLMDYPSVSHLNYQVRKNAINIIFAVTASQQAAYTNLAKNIDGASVGVLTSDSSNIIELVEEQYKKIASSLELRHNAPNHVHVQFYTACSGTKETESNKCDYLTVGEEITFRVEVKVRACPQNSKDWNQTFRIFPVGSQESMLVQLGLQCDCACEHPDAPTYIKNASECSNNGTLMCGACFCHEMHFGQKCECTYDNVFSASHLENDCKANGDVRNPDCSRRGVCFCGLCQCDSRDDVNEVISGKYCECDNFSCLRGNGELCGGHGVCECGKCSCSWGWTGEDCMCTTSTVKCIRQNRDETCSGRGNCTCNKCVCEEGYEGEFCEKEVASEERKYDCDKLLSCVLCSVHQTGDLNPDECAAKCADTDIELVDDLEEFDAPVCVKLTRSDCRVEYKYTVTNTSTFTVKALPRLDCPLLAASYAFSLGILGAILVIGIISLLLWKLIVTKKDEYEYKKFLQQTEREKWASEMSPLYKQPNTTYSNPTYKRMD